MEFGIWGKGLIIGFTYGSRFFSLEYEAYGTYEAL